MAFDSISPALSGVIGGLLATWLTRRWSRQLSARYRGTSRERLYRRHRAALWTANTLFLAGLLLGVALYPLGGFAAHDPHPVLLGFGLASALPLLALVIIPLLGGRDIREAFVAFAWGQGSPLWATYGILGAGLVALGFAIKGWIT